MNLTQIIFVAGGMNKINSRLCIHICACYNIFNTTGRNEMETLEVALDANGNKFAMPVCDNDMKTENYNIYSGCLVVNCTGKIRQI